MPSAFSKVISDIRRLSGITERSLQSLLEQLGNPSQELSSWAKDPISDALALGFTALSIGDAFMVVRLQGKNVSRGVFIFKDGSIHDILTYKNITDEPSLRDALQVWRTPPKNK